MGRKDLAVFAKEEGDFSVGEECFAIAERAEQARQTDSAHDFLQAAGLIEVEQRARGSQQRGRRQQATKKESAGVAGEPAALRVGLDFGARIFDQAAVGHAGRTGGFAGAAGEA